MKKRPKVRTHLNVLTGLLIFLVSFVSVVTFMGAYPYDPTDRADGTVLTHTIYNTDHDDMAINIGLPGNIDDISANATDMKVVVDPGEVGTESLATTLKGEIQRIRNIIKEITGEDQWYVSPTNTLQGLVGATQNILRFGDFESKSSATTTVAPDGWSLVGTPSAITLGASDASEAGANKIAVTADAAAEGISQTITATRLKASTKYTIWGKYKVGSGDSATVSTTGADTNCSQTSLSATTFTAVTCTFTTDSTPTSVVLQLLTDLATNVAHWDNFVVMEGNFTPGRFVPDFGSTGGIFAWAKGTNSGTPDITLGSGFTDTVGDSGTGNFVLNFTHTLADSNYAVFCTSVGGADGTDDTCKVVSQSTTQITLQTTANNSQSDASWTVLVIR